MTNTLTISERARLAVAASSGLFASPEARMRARVAADLAHRVSRGDEDATVAARWMI